MSPPITFPYNIQHFFAYKTKYKHTIQPENDDVA